MNFRSDEPDYSQLKFRVDKHLRDRLAAAAEERGVSLNREISVRLARSLEKPEFDNSKPALNGPIELSQTLKEAIAHEVEQQLDLALARGRFPFLNQLGGGESGEEGFWPLTRINGKLGVSDVGPSPPNGDISIMLDKMVDSAVAKSLSSGSGRREAMHIAYWQFSATQAAEILGWSEHQFANWTKRYQPFPHKKQGRGHSISYGFEDLMKLALVGHLVACGFNPEGAFALAAQPDEGEDSASEACVSIKCRHWKIYDDIFPRFREAILKDPRGYDLARLKAGLEEFHSLEGLL